MEIIPQEKQADETRLTEVLTSALEFTTPVSELQVFLFGSWATPKKSFTEGDVDIFVGVKDYCYAESPELATITTHTIPVHTTDGDIYPDRRIELHWGDISDFLTETRTCERVELSIDSS